MRYSALKVVTFAAALAPVLTSCGGHATAPVMPSAFHQSGGFGTQSGLFVDRTSGVQAELQGTSPDEITDATNPCLHPKFPLVCVKQGGSSTLGIQVNCTRNGKTISCGTVTWKTKTSHAGLTASFKPNPSGPPHGKTLETVRATKTIKVAHYYQLITATCSLVANCPKDFKAAIYVLK